MKVKELIKLLEEYNPDAVILSDINNSDSESEALIAWSYQNNRNDCVYFDSDKCKSKAKEISIKFESE